MVTERLARTLSILFHPFIAVTLTLALVAYFVELSASGALWWTTLYSLVVVAPVLALLLFQLRQGGITDIDVGLREQRLLYYTVGISSLVVLLWLLWYLAAPRAVLTFIIAATVCNVAAVIINRFTKVSVHAAAMAGCTAITVGLVPWTVSLLMVSVTVLLGWARIHLSKHTPAQVLLGWLTAAGAVAVVFLLASLG